MAEQLIILDPTEEVFGKCLEGISSGLITVMSRADFPVGERYPPPSSRRGCQANGRAPRGILEPDMETLRTGGGKA